MGDLDLRRGGGEREYDLGDRDELLGRCLVGVLDLLREYIRVLLWPGEYDFDLDLIGLLLGDLERDLWDDRGRDLDLDRE